LLAVRLAELCNVRVTVDNRPGDGATAAPKFVCAAPPDGRTLLLNTSAHAYSAAFRHDLPYDPISDFVAVAAVSTQPYVLVVPSTSGMRTLTDLVAVALARPGELRFASTGIGTGTHIGVEQLNADLGIVAVHAPPGPTDSIAETIARVAAGVADYAMAPISMAEAPIAARSLVALGVSAATSSRLLPTVPTIAEGGAAGFDFPIWYGIWAPAATPPATVDQLHAGVAEALATDALRARLRDHDAEAIDMTTTEFGDFVGREVERARRIANASE
jgi:tripartite-type tricarboxylate transporter receptor subunit TctC